MIVLEVRHLSLTAQGTGRNTRKRNLAGLFVLLRFHFLFADFGLVAANSELRRSRAIRELSARQISRRAARQYEATSLVLFSRKPRPKSRPSIDNSRREKRMMLRWALVLSSSSSSRASVG